MPKPKIEIYTTTYCPYCRAAKDLLDSKKVKYEEIDVTMDDKLREEMLKRSKGRTTVPEIFINGKLIGGYDDLRALDDERKLDELLKIKK